MLTRIQRVLPHLAFCRTATSFWLQVLKAWKVCCLPYSSVQELDEWGGTASTNHSHPRSQEGQERWWGFVDPRVKGRLIAKCQVPSLEKVAQCMAIHAQWRVFCQRDPERGTEFKVQLGPVCSLTAPDHSKRESRFSHSNLAYYSEIYITLLRGRKLEKLAAMRPAPALRPSSVVRLLGPRRVGIFHRCVSRCATRSVAELLQWRPAEKADDVTVNGFVRSVRSMKAHRFISIGDGSSLAPLQALVPADDAKECV